MLVSWGFAFKKDSRISCLKCQSSKVKPERPNCCSFNLCQCELQGPFKQLAKKYHDNLQDSQDRVKFLLLNTTKLPPGTFIFEVELVKFFAPHDAYQGYRSLKGLLDPRFQKKVKRGYYYGEYLSQGNLRITGACVQTDLQALMDRGLFDLLPDFGEEWRCPDLIVRGGILSLREALGETKTPTELWLPEISQFRMIIKDIQEHFDSQDDSTGLEEMLAQLGI
ncbi:hypothetical protein QBC36DRAFT_311096 [Triangularia setosa]|uniref:Uncharacterized protein n=1 Tax=Triangularia setosa TaxID=2587417 RepID=A0AAN6W783_9PEZI|nr:hypothetical protein QBC36DRAFT_311096 [Podospora setosa]